MESILTKFRELYSTFPIPTNGLYEQRIKGIDDFLTEALIQERKDTLSEVLTRLTAINSNAVSKDIKVHKNLIEFYIETIGEELKK